MAKLRMLLVDNEADTIGETDTVRIRILPGDQIGETQGAIASQIAAASFDLIAIGNCNGIGLYLVPCVPHVYRGAFVVVLSDKPLSESTTLPYRDMGVTNFCLRGPAFRAFVDQRRKELARQQEAARAAETDPSLPVAQASA